MVQFPRLDKKYIIPKHYYGFRSRWVIVSQKNQTLTLSEIPLLIWLQPILFIRKILIDEFWNIDYEHSEYSSDFGFGEDVLSPSGRLDTKGVRLIT